MDLGYLLRRAQSHIVGLRGTTGALNSREGFQGGRKGPAEKQGFFYCRWQSVSTRHDFLKFTGVVHKVPFSFRNGIAKSLKIRGFSMARPLPQKLARGGLPPMLPVTSYRKNRSSRCQLIHS